MTIKPSKVFTPGSFPTITYVERSSSEYEQRLQDSLEVEGQIVSIAGPSKSGKTVLVEHVVGRDNLIIVVGAGLAKPGDVWDRVLDSLSAPTSLTTETSFQGSGTIKAEAGGKKGIPLVAQGEAKAGIEFNGSASRGRSSSTGRRGLFQVVDALAGSDKAILIDDFHYMERNVQAGVAKEIKEAARLGLRIVTASVPHRSDDVVRANPELRGRVISLDLEYWSDAHLRRIAELGFNELGYELNGASINDFTTEAAGSPQLMQAICLNTCFELHLEARESPNILISPAKEERRKIFSRTSAATNFRSHVEIFDAGPKTRGTERKSYTFIDDTQGDIYRCVLKAVASDPPRLSFHYNDLTRRIALICKSEPPAGSSVTTSCSQISKLARDKFADERIIEWDENKTVLDLPEPYLLFYLRWSSHLTEPEAH